jgi:hypothetical protein
MTKEEYFRKLIVHLDKEWGYQKDHPKFVLALVNGSRIKKLEDKLRSFITHHPYYVSVELGKMSLTYGSHFGVTVLNDVLLSISEEMFFQLMRKMWHETCDENMKRAVSFLIKNHIDEKSQE